MICHHLCGNLGSLRRNGDSTRALQSSTSLFVAFITGPRWNIYKILFASLLKTSRGTNWLQRDATGPLSVCFVWLFPAGWHGREDARGATLCTPRRGSATGTNTRTSKSKRFLAREFWVQQELASESQRWGEQSVLNGHKITPGTAELQCRCNAPCSAFMVLCPLSSLGDLHVCHKGLMLLLSLYWAHDTSPALPFTHNKEYFKSFPHHLYS